MKKFLLPGLAALALLSLSACKTHCSGKCATMHSSTTTTEETTTHAPTVKTTTETHSY